MAEATTTAAPTAPAAAPTGGEKSTGAVQGATQAQVSHVEKNVSSKEAAEILHTLKVNGEEKQVPYEVLLALAQKADAADAKFREAAALQKRLKHGADRFKEDPTQLFKELGMDADEWTMKRAETLLGEILQDAELGPEAKQLREAQRKLKEYEEKEKADQDAKQRAAHEEATKRQIQEQGRLIFEAVELTSLPHTDRTALLMKQIAEGCVENGTPYTPKSLAFWAEQQEQESVRAQIQTLAKMGPERLIKFLGPEVLKVINSAELADVKKAPGSGAGANRQPAPRTEEKERERPKNRSDDKIIREMLKRVMAGKPA